MDETTKQKLLEELRKEYRVELKPLKEAKFSVAEILNKYMNKILDNLGVEESYKYTEPIGMAIRRVMCLKYGVLTVKDIPIDKRQQFKEDTEKFIKEFILKER